MELKQLKVQFTLITLAPVRINFLGGWSDQTCWQYKAAVVNAAVGWLIGKEDANPYPLIFAGKSFWSKISGKGTGLGISSILAAAKFLHNNFGSVDRKRYIKEALEWEERQGIKGGWQDQIGAIHPGFKLIVSDDHNNFEITEKANHPIMEHLVLFDSGVRRPAKHIGDQVRALITRGDRRFIAELKQNVNDAMNYFDAAPQRFAQACLEGWERLVRYVPEMDSVKMPYIPNSYGHMFVGAGGGGWGLYFMENPEDCDFAIEDLADRGYQAFKPILLDGIQHIEANIK